MAIYKAELSSGRTYTVLSFDDSSTILTNMRATLFPATWVTLLACAAPFFTLTNAAPLLRMNPRQQSPSALPAFNDTSPSTPSNTTITTEPSITTNMLPPIPVNDAATYVNSPDLMSQLRRSAEFTNAAYCTAATVENWACGPTCEVLGNITVLFTGGNNQLIPNYYIAHDPSTESIVVAQQGTDPTEILSILVDAQFLQSPLNTTLFPTAPNNAMVHSGFQDAFLRSIDDVQREVERAVTDFGVHNVLVTGHSLGAAIGVMNGVYLTQLFEGRDVNVTTQVFGLPRAGNSVWADFVDGTIGSNFVHMHLNHDPVPTVPPRGLFDYTHPSGEIFDSFSFDSIVNATAARDGSTAVFCPGRENENCSAGNKAFTDNILDHLGPYFTVNIGSLSCPH